MKHGSVAMAVAVSLVIMGCGGGGGGGTASNSGGSPPPTAPSTGGITTTPVVAGVASYSASRADFSITRAGSGLTLFNRHLNATSQVSGANAIRFSDITINLGIGDKAMAVDAARLKSLIELYMAFLKRVPDADGLSTWIDQLNAGQTMAQIAERLHAEAVLAPDVTGMSASMLHSEFVNAVYKDVFGLAGSSAPTASDLAYWASRIDKGGDLFMQRGALVVAMLNAARAGYPGLSSAAVVSLLDNRADMGDYVAVQQGVNYNSAEESLSRRKAIAAAVTSTDKAVALSLLGFSDNTFNLKAASK